MSTLQRRTETSERLCDQLTLEISRLNGLVAERTAQCDGLVDTAERLQQQWRRQEEVHLEEVEMFRSKAATSDNAVTTLSSEVGRLNEQSMSLGRELAAALRRLGIRHWQCTARELASAERHRAAQQRRLREDFARVVAARYETSALGLLRVCRANRRRAACRAFRVWLRPTTGPA